MALVSSGCSGGGDEAGSDPVSAEYTPGNELTLEHPSGAKLVILPSALPNRVTVTASVPPPTRRPGPAVVVVSTGLTVTPTNPGLTMPAVVSLPIQPTLLPAGSTVDDAIIVRSEGDVFVPLPTRRTGPAVQAFAEADTPKFGDFFAVVMVNPDGGVVTPDAGTGDASVTDGGSTDAGVDEDGGGVPQPCTLSQPFGTPVRLAGLDTQDDEIPSWMSADERTIYMTYNGFSDSGLWTATRSAFGASFVIAELPGQRGIGEREPVPSPDGLSLFFIDNDDLRRAIRNDTSANFSTGDDVMLTGLSGALQTPYVAASGNLYVAEVMDGGLFSGHGMYMAVPNGSTFNTPVELTELGDGDSPVLSADERVIYFAFEERIYVASRASTSHPFGDPVLVPNVHNAGDDAAPFHISSDGCRLYLSAEGNLQQGYDAFVATRPFVP